MRWAAKKGIGALITINQIFSSSLPTVTSTSEKVKVVTTQVFDFASKVPKEFGTMFSEFMKVGTTMTSDASLATASEKTQVSFDLTSKRIKLDRETYGLLL